MNIRTASSAFLTGLVSLVFSSLTLAQEGIAWTDVTGGTLAGSSVTVSGFTSGAQILPYDLSGSNYSGAPLSSSQDCMDHHAYDNWTAVFTPPINNGLLWYGKYTRGAGAGTGGALVEYTFDHPFVILSGFAQGTVIGNTLAVPESGFHHGILQFSGAVATLNCTTNATAGHYQACTLGQMGPLDPGTAYCPGDGVTPHTLCPCGNSNNGSAGGCDWGDPAFPEGGVLSATGSTSMAANDTLLVATGVADDFGIFFGADNQVNGGNGNPLNDGLRCAGGGLVRLIPPTMATGNQATLPAPVQTLDIGAAAGVTRRYQYWFRTPGGPCGQMANLTNGYELVWTL